LASLVDFKVFRSLMMAALWGIVRSNGGRLLFNPLMMFKVLVLQALYSLSGGAAGL
jgi:hypothetical protein